MDNIQSNEMDSIKLNENDINDAWGRMVAQYLMANLLLEKQKNQLELEYSKLAADNEDLREILHKAECDLLAAQGKAIIDKGSADDTK